MHSCLLASHVGIPIERFVYFRRKIVYNVWLVRLYVYIYIKERLSGDRYISNSCEKKKLLLRGRRQSEELLRVLQFQANVRFLDYMI